MKQLPSNAAFGKALEGIKKSGRVMILDFSDRVAVVIQVTDKGELEWHVRESHPMPPRDPNAET